MESKYVCPCGLICTDCLFYKKEFFEAANTMKKLIDEYRFDFFFHLLSRKEVNGQIAEHLQMDQAEFQDKFSIFEKMPEFVKVLEGIIAIQCKDTCREKNGCSIGGSTHACEVVECVNQKNIEGCWMCAENKTCNKLSFQKTSYGKTILENFEKLALEGLSSLQSRGNQYYEWQRKIIKTN
jgi:hypothetical protein